MYSYALVLLFTVKMILDEHRKQNAGQFDFNENPLESLPPDTKSLIERVVICQDQFEMPCEHEVTRVLSLAVSKNNTILLLAVPVLAVPVLAVPLLAVIF